MVLLLFLLFLEDKFLPVVIILKPFVTYCRRNEHHRLTAFPELLCVVYPWPDWRADSVFVALFGTAAERASCGVHKLLGSGGVPTTLSLFFRRWLTLWFGLCGSERLGRAIHRYPLPPPLPPHTHTNTPPLSPVPNRPDACGRKIPHPSRLE